MNARSLRVALCALACLPLLNRPASATQAATVIDQQELSDTQGAFGGALANLDLFGRSVAGIGDLDGDGVEDIAVGTMGDSENGANRGAVWIVFLNANGTAKSQQKINETNGGFTGTLFNSDRFGRSVAAIGDLNGDGRTELAVGAHLDDDGGAFQDRGAVWILFLNANGTVSSHTKISQTSGGFGGTIGVGDRFGFSVAALGDLDNDGVRDIAVGADRNDDGGMDTGAIWILFLNANGTVKAEQKISNTSGGFTGATDLANRAVGVGANSLASVGDLDNDGVVDLASGEPGSARSGDTLWILFLNSNGTVKGYTRIASGIGGMPSVLMMGDSFGAALAAAGDLNADGMPELAVGAPGDDDGGNGRGAIWLLSLNSDGIVADSSKISQKEGGFGGVIVDNDQFGGAIAAIGDIDGNGTNDLAVGAHLSDDGGDRRGSAWVLNLEQGSTPPFFVSSACESTLNAVVGQELSFSIEAGDNDPGDTLFLWANGLPAAATSTPMLPSAGSTLIRWTPGLDDVGEHKVVFRVGDSFMNVAICTVTIQVAAGGCATPGINRRQPGSLLLYPEFMNGPGRVTLLTVTNSNCDAVNGDVTIEFRYISGEDCSKRDHTALLTKCDTLSLLTHVHTGDSEGYVYIYAKGLANTDANSNGDPISFNHLIGQATVVDSFRSMDYSLNAISFQSPVEQGSSTDLDEDGVRDLDGSEYTPAPDKILIPRFLANDPFPGTQVSELILIALSGGRDFVSTDINPSGGTTVDFLIYNDNEEVFSSEYRFDCWEKPLLRDISGIFLNDFLRDSTNDDPSESIGMPAREYGWMMLDGGVASSVADGIEDPAIYAVLVEHVGMTAAADLPFESCSQTNGDLLPVGIFGDGPNAVAGDGK